MTQSSDARRAVRTAALVVAGVAAVAILAVVTWPGTPTPWSGTPGVYEVNRLDVTARTVPLESADAVLAVGVTEAEASSPWLASLSGEWSFRWSPSAAAAGLAFTDPSSDVSGWDTVAVPHNWQLDGYGDEATGDLVYLDTLHPWAGYEDLEPGQTPTEGASVGSYRREFQMPDAWERRRTILAFQGVKSAFTVWVNGVEVGYSEDSYAPAEFDVTDAVVPGTNTVAVLVHRWSDGSWLENQDQIDLSGIFRDVELYSVPWTHVDDVTVTTDVRDDLASALVTADIDIARVDETGDAVRAVLLDPSGAELASSTVELLGGEAETTHVAFDVDDPLLWTAETPDLYTLTYEVLEGADVIETTAMRVGIRELTVVDGQMLLNGNVLDIKGVNRGEMSPDVGQALTEEQMRADLVAMRQANITAVRISHYPASPTLYRLADEIGMYVMDEANLETHGIRPFPDGAPEWDAAVLDRIASMYERDKNHASVLWWSLGNEVGPGDVFQRAADWLRSVDSTRLVHFQEDSTVADIDGVFYPTLEELQGQAAVDTDRPWIMTEYQMAMGNSVGGLAEYWDVIDSSPTMQGGFIWDWADQAIRLPIDGGVSALPVGDLPDGDTYFSFGGDWGSYPSSGAFSLNGLVSPDRTPQPELAEVAAVYAPVELVSWDEHAAIAELRNENLVTDLAAYDVTWVLEADGASLATGALDVALAAGDTGRFAVPLPSSDAAVPGAEHLLTLEFRLREATAWADAGHRVAAIQVPVWQDVPDAVAPEDGGDAVQALVVDEAGDAIAVTGDFGSVEFDSATGALTSYVAGGRELLAGPSTPDFWRASTQNDEWNGLASAAAQWLDAGVDLDVSSVAVARLADGTVAVVVDATAPVSGDPSYALTSTVQLDGSIVVTAELGAADTEVELPAMGVEMLVDPTLTDLTWFGAGPHETWADRASGALVGEWTSTVAEQVFPHAVPQATGNHVGVRWLTLTDADGAGLMVTALGGDGYGDTVQAAALPLSESAIEDADHPYELEYDDSAVHLTIDAVQQGVGFSWGPRAVPSGTVLANEMHAMRWVLQPLVAGADAAAQARETRATYGVS